jgi:4-amino-4-deoxy-L-arabinose transferase-like glycosyltransferase
MMTKLRAGYSGQRDLLLAFALALGVSAVLAASLTSIGLHWDEGKYFNAGNAYLHWFRHPSVKTIDVQWSPINEHPPFHKLASAATAWILHDFLRLLNTIAAYRVSSLAFVASTVLVVFWLTLNLYGRAEAVLASLILFSIPRVFYEGHLVSLDLSAMALWTCVAAAVWHGWTRQSESPTRLGFVMGLALLTKFNAPFAIFSRYALAFKRYLTSERSGISYVAILKRELALAAGISITALVTFVVGWPWLWIAPFSRIMAFTRFHFGHNLLAVYYFGTGYASAPWHYPYVMLFLTTPAVLFCLFCSGLLILAWNWREDRSVFVLSNLLLPLVLVQLSPAKYDGVRLFLPAFPFVAIVSAVALTSICRRIAGKASSQLIVASSVALLLYLGQQNRHYYPFPDSYFSEWIGGIRGAERLGFDPQYWCGSSKALLDWMAEHRTAKFWAYPCDRILEEYFSYDAITWRPQMTPERDQADYCVFFNRTADIGVAYANQLRTAEPVMSVDIDGVRLAGIYTPERLPPGGPKRRR